MDRWLKWSTSLQLALLTGACFAVPTLRAHAQQARANDLLLAATFDESLDADASRGDGRAVFQDGMTPVPDGYRGRALRVRRYEFIRYDIERNLSLEEGTISFWACPDFAPARFDEQADGTPVQNLLAARIRTGDRIELMLDTRGESPVLRWTFSDGEIQGAIEQDVSDWEADEWRLVSVAWKRPNRVALRVGEGEWVERQTGAWPRVPESMFYDLYLGSGATQSPVSPLGRPHWFHGLIDELRIYSSYRHDHEMTVAEPSPTRVDLPAWPWAVEDRPRRIQLYLAWSIGEYGRWPAEVEVTPGGSWDRLDAAGRRRALDALRLVQHDRETGEPIEDEEGGLFRPLTVGDEAYWADTFKLRFNHEGELPATYALYYDPKPGAGVRPEPVAVPMVGVGERLKVGDRETVGPIGLGLRGAFDVADLDGDGDLDIWMSSGTSHRNNWDLFHGHYFLENLGENSGQPVFAPPTRILRAATPVGYLKQTATPQLADVNGDGKLDLFHFSRDAKQWIEFDVSDGRIVPTAHHEVPFRPDTKGERGRLIDWNDNGKLDLLLGKTVYFNQSVSAERLLVFDEQHKRDLVIPSVEDADWSSSPLAVIPIDWDGDGQRELIATNWATKVFVHEPAGESGFHFDEGRLLKTFDDHELEIPAVFPFPVFADWDGDGDIDMLWSNDGAWIGWNENIAGGGKTPRFRQTRYVMQLRPDVDAGSLAIAFAADWDDDGDNDLILGGSDEYVYLYENIGDANRAVWGPRQRMEAAGVPIELRAGEDGSLLGPQETDWGYTNPLVADWDGDGLKDLIVSGIRGEHHFFRNVGRPGHPRLDGGRLIRVDWGDQPRATPEWIRYEPQGDELITAHRCRPAALDWNGDGIMDYVTLDHESRWAVYLGKRVENHEVILSPGQRLFGLDDPYARAIVWNRLSPDAKSWRPHYAGRTVLQFVDWDGDGDRDLILDNVNARYYENVGGSPLTRFVDRGDMAKARLALHNSGPFAADMDGDGRLDLLVGGESGHVHYFSRAFLDGAAPNVIVVDDQAR